MADEAIGIGIVGYGKVVAGQHRRWIAAREGQARIVAVCDTTDVRRQAAEEENPDATIYEEYGKMLVDDGVDLVLVTTPPTTHCDLAVRAARAGKHVFVDKPFAMTRAEAEKMLSAAEDAGVVMHCNQSRRYDGEYGAICEVVASGRIGELKHVRSVWSQFGSTWCGWGIEGFNPTWRIQKAYGGGMIYDYMPHIGDQVLRLVDKPLATVFADTRGVLWTDEVDDHFSCLVRFEDGCTAYIEASNLARIPAPRWYVIGTKGCITAEKTGGPIQVLAEGMDEPETVEPVKKIDELHDNLLAACRGEADPNVTPDQLRATMGLIDAAFASARKGTAIVVG